VQAGVAQVGPAGGGAAPGQIAVGLAVAVPGGTAQGAPARNPQPDDPPLGPARCAPWAVMRPRGPIGHPLRAVFPVPGSPPGSGGVRDLESLGRAAQRPPIIDDTPGQAQPPGLGQRGITVGHEDLPVVQC
jgi:hypothetical protein